MGVEYTVTADNMVEVKWRRGTERLTLTLIVYN